jgi:hypothetical protein
MAEEFQKSMASVIDHFKSIMTDVSESYNKAKSELIELDKYVESKKREQREYNELISKLQQREELLKTNEENLKQREEDMKKEQDDGRKVSIIKNIQTQLHHKINELELANKQKDFYRRQSDVLSQILLKYNIPSISGENITLEQIESIILTSRVVEDNVPSTIEIIDSVSTIVKHVVNEEQTNVLEKEDVEQTEDVEEEDFEQTEDVEQTEVEDFEYRGKMYYIDRSTGDIYAKLEDDEVGDIIGHLDIINLKQKVTWNKKPKK